MSELVWDAIHESTDNMEDWKQHGGETDEKPDGLIQAIEAGTGIGKSLGYLIPAIAARRSPVIVSTRTKQLQRQLLEDDLPRARGILGQELKAVLAKGRSNYLCLTAWNLAQMRPPAEMSVEDFRLWDALPKWVEVTETGDREELGTYSEGDSVLWGRINCERCIGNQCLHKDDCNITKLRRELYEADLIIVNAALLLADRILREDGGGQILPDAPVLILDEAHEIEDQLTDSCAEQWSSRAMTLLFRELEEMASKDPEGVLATMRMKSWEQAWQDLLTLVPRESTSISLDDPRLNFGQLTDALSAWIDSGKEVFAQVKLLAGSKREIQPDNAMEKALWRALQGRISRAFQRMELIFAQPVGWVSTISREGPQLVSFKANPIDVKPFFHKYIRRGFEVTIMASATLRDGKGFNGLRLRLGLTEEEGARGVVVDSPFDFENQGLLFIPPDTPERKPAEDGIGGKAWIESSLATITRLLAASRGRALLLFTSRKMLIAFKTRLREAIPSITFFVQGDGLSRSQILSRFRKTQNAAVMGVASFWQGIDLPGDALTLVVVAALPFAPPDDPVMRARIREADAIKPGLGFNGIQVPQMTLKLKQGIGRLIRTRSDKGVVCILDPRLLLPSEDHLGKRYAAQARAALPPFPITRDWKRVEHFLGEI